MPTATAPILHFIARKAVEEVRDAIPQPRPLSEWRDTDAWVLLAEPGAGKTEAFKQEAKDSNGEYVTARDFVTLSAARFENRAPLYIDGLDEIRAGSASFSQPLDDIRRRLDELGRPPFRLSCREADWRSTVDQGSLRAVAPRGELTVLHLVELDDAEIVGALRDLEVSDPAEFVQRAIQQGIRSLLGNPLLLDLIVRAVGRHPAHWPESRAAIYHAACAQLAVEVNETHRAELRNRMPPVEQLIEDAGLLCAACLLSGTAGYTDAAAGAETYLRIEALPTSLGVKDVRAALAANLFIADGEARIPRHRTIAEFLAAGALAARVSSGLPIARVLALMSGDDGGIVDPLRGLHAWLASRCATERSSLIERDPLGVVLYGDLTIFSTDEKEQVLRALHREAERYPWFRSGHWRAQPFGSLGSADMAARFRELLASPERSIAHQSLLLCVLEAIEHGSRHMPDIAPALNRTVRDASFRSDVRSTALDAWVKQVIGEDSVLRSLLDDIESGAVPDPDDELTGRLLGRLYPKSIQPAEVVRYFHLPKRDSFIGLFWDFWHRRLVSATPRESLAVLMDAWCAKSRPESSPHTSSLANEISGRLLGATLSAHGDRVPTETIYRWLGAVLDKHGVKRLSDKSVECAQQWLNARPEMLKSLVAHGWAQLKPEGEPGQYRFWKAEHRVLDAKLPRDWYLWLLQQAERTENEELAKYCFANAAHLAVNPREGFDMTLEAVETWVARNRNKWPAAEAWLKDVWFSPRDHWQGEQARERQEREKKHRSEKERRRSDLLTHITDLKAGTAAPGLMHQIALAYDGRFYDIHGETPLERVRDFLGGTEAEASAVLDGQMKALEHAELPNVDQILETDRKGHSHYIRDSCLLGAKLAFKRDPNVVTSWPNTLAERLAGFWLTYGVGDDPEWFWALATARPSVVAAVMLRYAVQSLKKSGEMHIPGLWQLAQDENLAPLARLVVPALLRAFPARATEKHLRILNGELLPAASKHLAREEFAALVGERLARKSLDVPQRIACLVAGLVLEGTKYSAELLNLVGASETRAAHLGRAIDWQGDRRKGMPPLDTSVLARLIELLAPTASPERPTGAFWVGDADRRRDWVLHFINQLAASPSPETGKELARLAVQPRLFAWKTILQGAQFDQGRVRREATFRQANVNEVAGVLANKSPANAQDLAALLIDHLVHLEARLHGDDTNSLRLFYKDDRTTPKLENECRDVLLTFLRDPLRTHGVHLEKEGQAAQDTRADMRAEYVQPGKRLAVPLEIKKEDSQELWLALRTQLDGYALDPAADGRGIYLVLWFGRKPRPSPKGVRAVSPADLREALFAAIPEELRHKRSVFVLDLSQSR